MASTYEKIATTTVSGGSTATVTFSSISSSYTDLVVVFVGGCDDSSMRMQFNSDTGSNYSVQVLSGRGSTVSASRQNNQDAILVAGAYAAQTAVSNTIIQIQNYSNATTYKTALSRNNEATGATETFIGVWRSTAAITAVSLTAINATGFWFNGSKVTLYGIAKA